MALAVALGGTGYAVTQLPKNAVGTAQLKNNAVTAGKVRNNAITGAKVKDGSLTARDFQPGTLMPGPAGPQGATGPQGTAGVPGQPGQQGARGPSDGYFSSSNSNTPIDAQNGSTVGSITLPPGKYLVTATGTVTSFRTAGPGFGSAQVSCFFPSNRVGTQTRRVYREGNEPEITFPLEQTLTIPAYADLTTESGPTTLLMDCSVTANTTASLSRPSLSAVAVENLTESGP